MNQGDHFLPNPSWYSSVHHTHPVVRFFIVSCFCWMDFFEKTPFLVSHHSIRNQPWEIRNPFWCRFRSVIELETLFFRSSSEKNSPRIGVLVGFIGVGWENYVVKSASIAGASKGIRWGVNLSYFGKLNDNCAYFPHETKRTVLRGFHGRSWSTGKDSKPESG